MNTSRIWRGAALALLLAGLAGPGVLLVAAKSGAHSVTLSWNAPPPTKGFTVAGYNVYRRTKSGKPYVKIASRVLGFTYVDRTVKSGKTYFYVVTAVDQADHESRFSEEIKSVVP